MSEATTGNYNVGGIRMARPFRPLRLGHFGWNYVDSKKTLPVVGFSSARSILISVVLPAPECPTTETNSPGSTEKEISSKATELSAYIFDTRS